MQKAPIPANDAKRVASLRRMNLLGTPAEAEFDRIARVAKQVFDVPITLISLVDERRQWFKASIGIDVCETSRDVSFCGHAILEDRPMVIPDALADARFADNPLVVAEPFIRFYAGCPLRNLDGEVIGTLCLIDTRPRQLTVQQLALLQDLGGVAESLFAARSLGTAQRTIIHSLEGVMVESRVDPRLRIWNRGAIDELLQQAVRRCARAGQPVAVLLVDVDHFKRVNDLHGHPAGDRVLVEVAQALRHDLRMTDSIGRYGGEEFLVVLPNTERAAAETMAARMLAGLRNLAIPLDSTSLRVTASVGVAGINGAEAPLEALTVADPESEARRLIWAADAALLRAKRNGRDRVEVGELGERPDGSEGAQRHRILP